MAKIESIGAEIVANHTTEEIIAFLARESKTLWSRLNTSSDPDQELIRNSASYHTLFGFIWALDAKVNGTKPTTVL